jgi:hypothetical protein
MASFEAVDDASRVRRRGVGRPLPYLRIFYPFDGIFITAVKRSRGSCSLVSISRQSMLPLSPLSSSVPLARFGTLFFDAQMLTATTPNHTSEVIR